LGGRVAALLRKGDVVLFLADLGAGKTTMIQGMARKLGAPAPPSPTFILAQTLDGRVPIHHMDFYRVTAKEIAARGLGEYFSGGGEIPSGIVLVEWAERSRGLWPKERLEIRIRILPKSADRRIAVRGVGRRYREFAKLLGR
jgi:tRNA threonylcarbamoyladenosine biosynthesis protein TsaE